MDYQKYGATGEKAGRLNYPHVSNECARRKSADAHLRALKLFVLASTAQKYGGTMEFDLVTDTVEINVPKEALAACTREAARQLGAAFRFYLSEWTRPSTGF